MSDSKKYTTKQHAKILIRGMKIYKLFPKHVMLSISLSSIAEAVIPFINIFFAAQILNELSGERRIEHLVVLVVLTIGLNLVGFIIQKTMSRWEEYCRNNTWEAAYKVLSDKAISMDFSDTDNAELQGAYSTIRQNQWSTGFGLVKLEESAKEAIQGITRIALAIFFAFTLFTLYVPTDSSLSWLDSAWVLGAMLLVFTGPIILTPHLNTLGGKVWAEDADDNNKATRFMNHFFFNIHHDSSKAKDIRIYNQKRAIQAQIDKDPEWNWRNNQTYGRLYKKEGKYIAAGVAITYLCNGLVFLYVTLKALGGAFSVGNIVLYVGALTQLGMGLSAVMTSIGQIFNNNPFLALWFNFLDTPSKMHQGNMKVEDQIKYEFEFRNVSFKYPRTEEYVLINISLKLNIGVRHAIVGENGSGKTTLIKLLCRLYDPNEGEILLNGIDIKNYDYDEYMSIFNIVFQDFKLMPFTLGQNVSTSMNYDKKRVLDSLKNAGFNERLGTLSNGLETYLYKNFEEDGVEVSNGEAQKIALARAIYRNAPFIILDEPTAALDPIAEHKVYSKMNEIVGKKTAIFVSHRLSSCRFCDEIIVFHNGEVIQRGSHDNLMNDSSNKYYELWNAQAQYYKAK